MDPLRMNELECVEKDSIEENENIQSSLAYYISSACRHSYYTAEEEKEIFKRYKKENTVEIRNEIVCHYLKFVVSVAKKYWINKTKTELMDLVSAGNLGLMRAIETFDVEQGNRFTTYAYPWIRQHITRYIADCENDIRIPANKYEKVLKLRKAYAEATTVGTEINDEYLMKELNINKDELYELERSNSLVSLASLNDYVDENEHDDLSELGDFQVSDEMSIESRVIQNECTEKIDSYINMYLETLPIKSRDRMQDIIYKRFGLHGHEEETLEVLGERYGISRERVRQLQDKFLKWMKTPEIKEDLAYYL